MWVMEGRPISGGASNARWLTGEHRRRVEAAVLGAHLLPGVAPDGYAELRGRLWVQLKADRTVPAWDEFERTLRDLIELLMRDLDVSETDATGARHARLTFALERLRVAMHEAQQSGGSVWG